MTSGEYLYITRNRGGYHTLNAKAKQRDFGDINGCVRSRIRKMPSVTNLPNFTVGRWDVTVGLGTVVDGS